MVKCSILLSCPCLHVRSFPFLLSASPASSILRRSTSLRSDTNLTALRPGVATASLPPPDRCRPCASCRSPSWSLRALRRFVAGAATCAPARLAPRSHAHWVYLPSSAASSEFCTPSTLSSASCRPALFRAGTVLGLPHLRRFLPARSLEDLSALDVLHAVSRLRAAAPRILASGGCVVAASRG